MGVTNLWKVLEPVKQKKTLSELRGKRVAVDISGWLCEAAQAEGACTVITKILRTVFYRIRQLLRHQIWPVFVVEGKPPQLKSAVLKQRQLTKGFMHLPDNKNSQALQMCIKLIEAFGLPYIRAEGEAEAMCASINEKGFVDACITNDGDAFLFGATCIYKNFKGNDKDQEVECYSMSDIKKDLGLDRSKLIALALLVGCDYTDGIHGVGWQLASKLLKTTTNTDVFTRLKSWHIDPKYARIEAFQCLAKPTHCSNCKHIGTRPGHLKNGCPVCKTHTSCGQIGNSCSCDWHRKMAEYRQHKEELHIRKLAIKSHDFPSEQVISEFLHPSVTDCDKPFSFTRPNVLEIERSLQHFKNEISQDILPVLTAWDMAIKTGSLPHPKGRAKGNCDSVPAKIIRATQHHFAPVYEVHWECVEGVTGMDLKTKEEKEVFSKAFPEITKAFEDEQKAIKETPRRWQRKGRTLREQEQAAKNNRKITDMLPMKKKKFLKRTRDSECGNLEDGPQMSAKKRLLFCDGD